MVTSVVWEVLQLGYDFCPDLQNRGSLWLFPMAIAVFNHRLARHTKDLSCSYVNEDTVKLLPFLWFWVRESIPSRCSPRCSKSFFPQWSSKQSFFLVEKIRWGRARGCLCQCHSVCTRGGKRRMEFCSIWRGRSAGILWSHQPYILK